MEAQCAITWEKVANCVLEILAQHIPEGQVGVFLAALYQFMCNKKSPPWWSLKLVSQYTLGSTVGHTGIYEPVICSSDSRPGFPKWPQSSYHSHGLSDITTSSTNGASAVHSHTTGREHNSINRVVPWKASQVQQHGCATHLSRK